MNEHPRFHILVKQQSAFSQPAACANLPASLFFGEHHQMTKQEEADAKAVCVACPAKQECREIALRNNEQFGVWGGMSAPERRRYKRNKRNLAARIARNSETA